MKSVKKKETSQRKVTRAHCALSLTMRLRGDMSARQVNANFALS